MNRHFQEVITHRVLSFKLTDVSPASDSIVEDSPTLKAQFKNVCAPIPLELNNELEQVLDILNLSKRVFFTMAISSAITEAKKIMQDFDIFENEGDFILGDGPIIPLSDEEVEQLKAMTEEERSSFIDSKVKLARETTL
jgi:hypothetical protein